MLQEPEERGGRSRARFPQRITINDIFFGPDGLRALWGILLFFAVREAIQLCLYPLLGALFPSGPMRSGQLRPGAVFAFEAAGVTSVLIATWAMSKIEHRPASVYGLGGTRRVPQFLTGLAWGAAMLSLLVFALRVAGFLAFDGRLLSAAAALRYGAIWLAGFFLVGFGEEYLFRGYLQYTLARGLSRLYGFINAPARDGLGFWTAAFVLSFGFGLTHTTNRGESPIGLVAAGLIAMVFCFSLWRSGSLWWAIGFHTAWDCAESFLYGVADSGLMVRGHLFATHPVGRPIYSGGVTGPEGSVLILPIVALTAIVIHVTLPKRSEKLPQLESVERDATGNRALH